MDKPEILFPRKLEMINPALLEEVVALAIREDLGDRGDITSDALLSPVKRIDHACVIAKEPGVICGADVAVYVYTRVDPEVRVTVRIADGQNAAKGDTVLEISGQPASITKGERISLNFLGLMSGIATKARELSSLVAGSGLRLLDTRKTLPGLREFQKYAVQVGGASNHRIGLYDMFLIKENHIAAAGGVARAVELAKRSIPDATVEIEVETLEQVREALMTGAEILMLDNMDNEKVKEALGIIAGRKWVEVSGNITRERLPVLAALGVDFVSMGSLTHTLKPLDLSLLMDR
jgi:nicotinate-nucleotide pyrophosphorylase (carboxylating)